MGAVLFISPEGEPVELVEAKAHLRVDTAEDDTLIGYLITAAREHVEDHCRRALLTQTWDLFLDDWPAADGLMLPWPRLQSVESVTYYDADGGAGVVFDAENYLIDTAREPGRLWLVKGASWPSVDLRPVNGVQIRFVAGYGDADDVPRSIKQAILLLVGSLYENREDIVVAQGVNISRLPFGFEALLRMHRVFRFA